MKKVLPYVFLNILVFIYSLSSLCSKMAANMKFLSNQWLVLYGLVIFFLAIYAVLWQQVLKKVPLNIAYSSKALTLVWGILWGMLVYGEKITSNNIIGGILVFGGVIFMVTGGVRKYE